MPDMNTATKQDPLGSPVDDGTYNLLQALTSKLEAIEAYERYQRDDDSEIFQTLLREDRQHAEQLLDALRSKISR